MRFIIVFFCMACMVLSAGAEETQPSFAAYDLPGLYRLALERAETIKIAEADLGIARNYKNAAFSALLPRISAFDSYTRYTESNAVQPQWSNAWGGLLTYTFTLNGRELLAFGIAADNIEGKEHQLREAKESYLLAVAATYYDALKAAEMEKAARENLERLETHRAAVESRLRLGEVTRPDVYRTDAELSSARADLTDAQNARHLAESSLSRLAGLETAFAIVPPAAVDISPLSKESLADLQGRALSLRPDLKARKVAEKMALSQIKLEKSAYWPTVSLEGGYTYTEVDPKSFRPEEESVHGGVSVNVPIFDGGLRKANKGTAVAELEKARLAREGLEKDIRVEVEQAWRDLSSRLQRREALCDKLAFARENFVAVSKQFDYGLATSIDKIDANTLFTQAAKELAAAEYECAVASLRLEKATGAFLETVMGVLNNT
ncbi:MAG: TolC family protein [Thermodesulfobacteriota bacterium]